MHGETISKDTPQSPCLPVGGNFLGTGFCQLLGGKLIHGGIPLGARVPAQVSYFLRFVFFRPHERPSSAQMCHTPPHTLFRHTPHKAKNGQPGRAGKLRVGGHRDPGKSKKCDTFVKFGGFEQPGKAPTRKRWKRLGRVRPGGFSCEVPRVFRVGVGA